MQKILGMITMVETVEHQFSVTADYPFYHGELPFFVTAKGAPQYLVRAEPPHELLACRIALVPGVLTVRAISDRTFELVLEACLLPETRLTLELVSVLLKQAHPSRGKGVIDEQIKYLVAA